MTQWSFVEYGLFGIAYHAFGNDMAVVNGPVQDGYYSIENFRSRLTFVDRTFSWSKSAKTFADEWAAVRENVRRLSSRRNELAHGIAISFFTAPPGRQIALCPLHSYEAPKKQNLKRPPSGSLCLKDIDLIEQQFAKADAQLGSLSLRMRGAEDHYAERALREPRARTLAQITQEIRAMLEPRDDTSPA